MKKTTNGAHLRQQSVASVCLSSMLFLVFAPLFTEPTYAQTSSWRERMERSNEGDDVDYEDLRERRRSSTELRRKIDRLDDDIVEDLPIPILFGITLSQITPNFGDPRGGGTRTHEGLDMLAEKGTPIVSPTDAVVIRIGEGTNSGLNVSTANPGDETFIYMHLDSIAEIESGDELKAGDLIGYVGNTGNASGGPAHLHFEIRADRRALDPYKRITEEFTLAEKMEFVERMLERSDDEEELAEFLVAEFENVFAQAALEGIVLPDAIADLLPGQTNFARAGSGAFSRDLTVGSQGADVARLQSILISEGFLQIPAPTGYFGAQTESALAAYQTAHSIVPSVGYFGSVTRAYVEKNSSAPAADKDELTLETIITLFLALGIITPEKRQAAYDALEAIE